MTGKNARVLLLAALGMGWIAFSVIYAVKRRYEQARREAEPIQPIPALENHLRVITVPDDTHIRPDLKNRSKITLAYLNDTDDLPQTARAHISE